LYEHVGYFPFGETWVEQASNTENLPYLFTGKELDQETGLYYFGARYYDPRTSVWQSSDPGLSGFLGDGRVLTPVRLSVFAYAAGNPVRVGDPDGRDIFDYARGIKQAAINDVALMYAFAQKAVNAPLTPEPEDNREVLGALASDNYLSGAAVVDAIMAAPGQIVDAVNADSDYRAGLLAYAPTKTTMLAAGMLGGVAMAGEVTAARTLDAAGRVAQAEQTVRSGTYGQLRSAGAKDAHHVIQDAAVRDLPGYSRSAAPAVKLEGPSTRVGSPHYRATQVQRQAGGGTYAAERRIGYKAMRRGGISPEDARGLIRSADDYFQSLGVKQDTATRIPGDRQ
jgi:RHS repeat-associated protein